MNLVRRPAELEQPDLAVGVAGLDLHVAQLLDSSEVEAGVTERGQRIEVARDAGRLGVAVRAEDVVVDATLQARVEQPLQVLRVVPGVAGLDARWRQASRDDDDVRVGRVRRAIRQAQEAHVVGGLLAVDRLIAPLAVQVDLVPDLDGIDSADG